MVRIRKVRVIALALPVAFAAVAGTALADPVLVEAMGLDVWHVGQLERELRESQLRDDSLERQLQSIFDRAATHKLIQDDLVAGRLTLPEAAKQKWEMNRDRAEMRDFLDRTRFGPSPEARMAHDLLEKAFDCYPQAELRQRLSAEYEAAYGIAPPQDR